MEFYTQWKRPDKEQFLEKDFGPSMTEQSGCIPPKIQIENILMAGERLAEYRRNMYDFGYGETVDESFEDPTRNVGFDMADASEIAAKVASNLRRSKEASRSTDPSDKADPADTGKEEEAESDE